MAGFYPGAETYPGSGLIPGKNNYDEGPEPEPTEGILARWLNRRTRPHPKHRSSRAWGSRYTPAG